nr:hypothetical protein [Bacillus stratosphericus]
MLHKRTRDADEVIY